MGLQGNEDSVRNHLINEREHFYFGQRHEYVLDSQIITLSLLISLLPAGLKGHCPLVSTVRWPQPTYLYYNFQSTSPLDTYSFSAVTTSLINAAFTREVARSQNGKMKGSDDLGAGSIRTRTRTSPKKKDRQLSRTTTTTTTTHASFSIHSIPPSFPHSFIIL